VLESGDSQLLKRKGQLYRLKESRLRLPSTKNDLYFYLLKSTKHFCQI
jgi:hypothetical protein